MSDAAVRASGTILERVGVDWTPTPLNARLRLGLVALATDHASETELHRMLPGDDVDLLVTRVHHSGQCDLASLRAMENELASAADLLLPGTSLDAIAYGCTSGGAAIGPERVAETIRARRPEVAVTTPLAAAQAAFAELGVERVAVLTPYVDEVNEIIVGHLEQGGTRVSRLATFGLETDQQMSSVPPEAIERAVLAMDPRDADAVFISCTALRSAQVIAPLEGRLGLPVIASNQAMLHAMLRAGGCDRRIPGFGRLLAGSGTAG